MATSEIKRGDPGIDPKTGEFRVVGVSETFKSVTEKISGIVLTPHTPLGWLAFFGIAGAGATVLLVAVTWLFLKGVVSGPSPSRSRGDLRLSTSYGGSASATPAP